MKNEELMSCIADTPCKPSGAQCSAYCYNASQTFTAQPFMCRRRFHDEVFHSTTTTVN